MKRVPSFWWDFEGEDEIVVESDSDKYPIVARFKYNPKDGIGCAGSAISRADAYIEDLKAGRVIPRA